VNRSPESLGVVSVRCGIDRQAPTGRNLDRQAEAHFAARAAFHHRQILNHLWHQNITTDDRQIGWRALGRRLLHETLYFHQASVITARLQDPVAAGLIPRNLRDDDNIATGLVVNLSKLRQTGLVRLAIYGTPVWPVRATISVPGLAAARATAAIRSVTETVVFGLANRIRIDGILCWPRGTV
jgi:hypothetical protein